MVGLLFEERKLEFFRSFVVEGLHRILSNWNGQPHSLENLHASSLPADLSDSSKVDLSCHINKAVFVHGAKILRLGYYDQSIWDTYLDDRVPKKVLPLVKTLSRFQETLRYQIQTPLASVYELNASAQKVIDLYYNDTEVHLDKVQVIGATRPFEWIQNYQGHSIGTFYASKRNIFLWATDFIAWQMNLQHRKIRTAFQTSCLENFHILDSLIDLDAVYWLNDKNRSRVKKDKFAAVRWHPM